MQWTLVSSGSLHVHGTFLTFHPNPGGGGGGGGGGAGINAYMKLKYWDRLHGVDRCGMRVSMSDIVDI